MPSDTSCCRQLYERFHDAFCQYGEPNIPVDKALMQTPEFFALLDRLRSYAEQHHRDHWVLCSACAKWRIISYEALAAVDLEGEWTCKLLRSACLLAAAEHLHTRWSLLICCSLRITDVAHVYISTCPHMMCFWQLAAHVSSSTHAC